MIEIYGKSPLLTLWTDEEIREFNERMDLEEGPIAWSGMPPPEALKAEWMGFKWVVKE